MRLISSFAALAVSASTVLAADLGGSGIADLEERVAELEATTARKGTRKTSLEVWGQVNKAIVAWNDGNNHNVNLGADNTNASTRFGFRGSAKVSGDLSAGYSMVIEQASGAKTSTFTQGIDKVGVDKYGFGTNDAAVTLRESNWWLESVAIGRVTVGRFVNPAAPQGNIDLGGISNVAGSSMSLIGGSLAWNTGMGLNPIGATLANTTDAAGNYGTRENGVSYVSPTIAGFSLAASAGGALTDVSMAPTGYGLTTGVALKYANEFDKTIRVAAAIGYERAAVEANNSLSTYAGGASTNTGLSLSAMHVPTGVFAQGYYNTYVRGDGATATNAAHQWMVQAGISKNWFGIGATAPYAEYGIANNGMNAFLLPTALPGATGIPASKVAMLGLGVTQNIDAAAMQIYGGYRTFKASTDLCTLVDGCKDIGIFTLGAAIKF